MHSGVAIVEDRRCSPRTCRRRPGAGRVYDSTVSRARKLFPVLDNPEYRAYVLLLDQCAIELLDGHVNEPELDAIVLERRGAPECAFASTGEIALMLLKIGDKWGKEAGGALRELSKSLLSADRLEPGFYVVVVTRRGAVMLWLPSKACADRATYHIALAIAMFRGFSSGEIRGAERMPGLGYAVRSPDCRVCTAWAAALREAKIPLVGRVSPELSPCEGDVCQTCSAEVTATEQSSSSYGLSAAELARISAPASVLEVMWTEEDLERAQHGGA